MCRQYQDEFDNLKLGKAKGTHMNRIVAMLTSEESFHNNYGAALQGYALYNAIAELGHKPVVVRYRGGVLANSKAQYYIKRIKRSLRIAYSAYI